MRKLKARKAKYGYSLKLDYPSSTNMPNIIKGLKAHGQLATILDGVESHRFYFQLVSTSVHGDEHNLYTDDDELGQSIDLMLANL